MKRSTIVRLIRLMATPLSTIAPPLAARWLERLFLTPTPHQRPAREQRWINEMDAQKIYFDDKRQIPVYATGEGPTVLLVHGWSGRGSQLGAFIKPLVQQGLRVVTFDAPAHGDADGRMTGLPELARAIEVVAQHSGSLYGIIAHSLGTSAATIALANGLNVQKLVYIAPPDNPGLYLYHAATYLGFSQGVAQRAQRRVEQRFNRPFASLNVTELARSQSIPLHIYHDEKDRQVALRQGRNLAKHWPGATLSVSNGLGHHRILRDPEVVASATTFMTHMDNAQAV